jgi:peptidoglycan/LPS O-acetylase OafA/YrhL
MRAPHFAPWSFLRMGLPFDASSVPNKIRVAIEFAATLLVASASWRYIEQPVIKWARSRKAD